MRFCGEVNHNINTRHQFANEVAIANIAVNESVPLRPIEFFNCAPNTCIGQRVQIDDNRIRVGIQ